MIRVTIELVPFGFENRKRVIGQLKIVNDGSGNLDFGNYKYELKTFNNEQLCINEKSGNVKRIKRTINSFWTIIQKAIDNSQICKDGEE